MRCHTLTIFNQSYLLHLFTPPSFFFISDFLCRDGREEGATPHPHPLFMPPLTPLVAAPEVTARRMFTLSMFLIICKCEKQLLLPRLILIFPPTTTATATPLINKFMDAEKPRMEKH